MRPHAIYVVYRQAWWSCPTPLCWRATAAEAEDVASRLQEQYTQGRIALGYTRAQCNRALFFYRELTDEIPENACP